jgi:hypothetical protein
MSKPESRTTLPGGVVAVAERLLTGSNDPGRHSPVAALASAGDECEPKTASPAAKSCTSGVGAELLLLDVEVKRSDGCRRARPLEQDDLEVGHCDWLAHVVVHACAEAALGITLHGVCRESDHGNVVVGAVGNPRQSARASSDSSPTPGRDC